MRGEPRNSGLASVSLLQSRPPLKFSVPPPESGGMRKDIGTRLAVHARLAWAAFGILVLVLLLVPELTRAL